jgi:hypothetical protein
MRSDIEQAKEKLRIPGVWSHLGLAGKPSKSCRCPWREDKKPSLSVFQDGRAWNDFATGEGGDAIDFFAKATGLERGSATRQFIELAGLATSIVPVTVARQIDGPKLPDDFRRLTRAEGQQLAKLRRLSLDALSTADSLGLLRFGKVHGVPSWILTDSRQLCIEARTMSGKPFPAVGKLPERKAHTIAGSKKSWPIGAAVLGRRELQFTKVMLVEGGPDLLAAIHFLHERGNYHTLPVALLGREAGKNGIHPEALPLFAGKHVRIYPHCDPDGGGDRSAKLLAEQLIHAGATNVDGFSFANLRRSDGKRVTDLNDAVLIAPERELELQELLP